MSFLTISKKFEIATALPYIISPWTREKLMPYTSPQSGQETVGQNFTLHFSFAGPLNPVSGMVAELSYIKAKMMERVLNRYDHHCIGPAHSPTSSEEPMTLDKFAARLLAEAADAFKKENIIPVVCHLVESPVYHLTIYENGRVDHHYYCNAVTASDDGKMLFPVKVRFTFPASHDAPGNDSHVEYVRQWESLLHGKILKKIPRAEELFNWVKELEMVGPSHRIKVDDEHFYFELRSQDDIVAGKYTFFNATHQLMNPTLDSKKNQEIYGPCTRLHGHNFLLDMALLCHTRKWESVQKLYSDLTNASQTLAGELHQNILNTALPEMKGRVPTCENLTEVLWNRLDNQFKEDLYRIRLTETQNNKFTRRR